MWLEHLGGDGVCKEGNIAKGQVRAAGRREI